MYMYYLWTFLLVMKILEGVKQLWGDIPGLPLPCMNPSNGKLFLLTWQSILYQHIHVHVHVHTTCLDRQQQNHAFWLLLHTCTSAISWLSFPGTAMDVTVIFKTVVEHGSSARQGSRRNLQCKWFWGVEGGRGHTREDFAVCVVGKLLQGRTFVNWLK